VSIAYDPSIFSRVTTLAQAKAIILTPEETLSTEQRWELETPHVCDLIEQHCPKLTQQSVVVDYGCGIGRIARELIKRCGCWVVGVDIAANMRALAASYVGTNRFMSCDPLMIERLSIKADLILAIWVLQHVNDIEWDLGNFNRMQARTLFVLNEGRNRFIPTEAGWVDDGIDVRAKLRRRYKLSAIGTLDPMIVGEMQSERTFWSVHEMGGR